MTAFEFADYVMLTVLPSGPLFSCHCLCRIGLLVQHLHNIPTQNAIGTHESGDQSVASPSFDHLQRSGAVKFQRTAEIPASSAVSLTFHTSPPPTPAPLLNMLPNDSASIASFPGAWKLDDNGFWVKHETIPGMPQAADQHHYEPPD